MLNDHEGEVLREIERGFLSEDPDFAESFTARAQHLPHPARTSVGITTFLVAGLVVSALMLVIGSLGGAAAFATGTGCIWLAWRFGAAVTAGPGGRSR